MLILSGIFLALALIAWFRGWHLMQGDAKGPDAVALYAAAMFSKGLAGYLVLFAIVAGIIHIA